MRFSNRKEAGERLAAALSRYKGQDCVVYALPRGGVPVAAEIAAALAAPLDVILVRKIGAPWHPELAIGAVVDGGSPTIVRLPDLMRLTGTTEKEFDEICARERAEIERRRWRYVSGAPPIDPRGRIAIVVDDGIATGATMRAALQATRRRGPKKLILAVPVAARESLAELRTIADEVVCLSSPEPFEAVGLHYLNFEQTTDEEVVAALTRLRAPSAESAPAPR